MMSVTPTQPQHRRIAGRNMLLRHALLACLAASAVPVLAQTNVPAEPPARDSLSEAMVQARNLATSGKREEALARYAELLQAHPGNGDLLLARGRTYAWMSRWAEAEADLLAVTTASPDYADAWSGLGDMYLWSDRPQQAAEAYAHWAHLRQQDPAPRLARGRALRNAGDREAARAEFESARALGAPVKDVDGFLASLQQRMATPDAMMMGEYTWQLRGSAGRTIYSGNGADYTDYEVSLRRKFEHGSLAIEGLGVHRFGKSDQAIALDGYVSLWERAYANLRYQNGPSARLFPQHAWRAELYQGVGSGWELSASIDQLRFSSRNVDIYGIGVGKYVGNYYLRGRMLYVPGQNGGRSIGYRALMRYYYAGDGDQYFEASAGFGNGRASIPGSNGLVGVSNNSLGLAYVKFPSPRWGYKIGIGFGNESLVGSDRGVNASIYRRW